MPAPKRRITAAGRDRALRLRKKLTASVGVMGTTAVAVLGIVAYHTNPGTSSTSAGSTSSVTSSTTTATPSSSSSSSSTSTGSSSLSTGSASTGSSSSASTVSGGS
jgi:hypothetical protein